LIKKYNVRQTVAIKINSGYRSEMAHYRFHGKVGTIQQIKNNSYIIDFPKLSKKLTTNSAYFKTIQ